MRAGTDPAPEPWNLNIQLDRQLVELVTPGSRVLDVGCGDGFLSARLADRGCRVTGLDVDPGVLQRARERWAGRPIYWVQGDVLSWPVEPGTFDAVVSNAALHHLPDTAAGLRRFAELTAPGGRVGVVGFARNGLLDWPMSLIGAVGVFVLVRARRKWEHTAPTHWPPPLTYAGTRRVAAEALPGSRFRRLWVGRYLLTWTAPATPPG